MDDFDLQYERYKDDILLEFNKHGDNDDCLKYNELGDILEEYINIYEDYRFDYKVYIKRLLDEGLIERDAYILWRTVYKLTNKGKKRYKQIIRKRKMKVLTDRK